MAASKMTAQKMDVEAVLFDLDGTLIDTAPDLAGALNAVLESHNRQPLPLHQIRPYVSQGAMALIRLGFELHADDAEAQQLFQELLDYYENNLYVHSQLFDGMAQLLADIEASKRPWGVVTNKFAYMTDPLMTTMQLYDRAGCVISGDTLSEKKPHPAPMYLASKQVGIEPEKCLFIGDDRRDIEAGQSAGMYTLAAAYGYIAPNDPAKDWGADGLVANVSEIRQWLSFL